MKKIVYILALILALTTLPQAALLHPGYYGPVSQVKTIPEDVSAYVGPLVPLPKKQWERHVVEFVHSAAAYVRQHGRIRAAYQFNQKMKPFYVDGLSVFAVVCNDNNNDGIVLADIHYAPYVYEYQARRPWVHKIVDLAMHHPNGVWITYAYVDPITKRLVDKRGFFMAIPQHKICLGSSYFQSFFWKNARG